MPIERVNGDTQARTPPPPSDAPPVYDASMIQVLEGLAPIRRRPGMYVGHTGSEEALCSLLDAIWELRTARPDASQWEPAPPELLPSHLTITYVGPRRLRAHLTRARADVHEDTQRLRGHATLPILVALSARLDLMQGARWARYARGVCVWEARGGGVLKPAEVALDLEVDTTLITGALSWARLVVWAWRRACADPTLRLTLLHEGTGERREIEAPAGLVTWARTWTDAPLMEVTTRSGSLALRLVVGRLATRRGMMHMAAHDRTASVTSGPLISAICRALTGQTPRERLRAPDEQGWRERRATPPAGLLIVGSLEDSAGVLYDLIDQSGRRCRARSLITPTQAALGAALPRWRLALALHDAAMIRGVATHNVIREPKASLPLHEVCLFVKSCKSYQVGVKARAAVLCPALGRWSLPQRPNMSLRRRYALDNCEL